MPQPGAFGNLRGEDWIGREITDIKRQIRELAAANPFGLSGMRLKNGGVVVEGYQTVTGTSTVNGAQTVNGALTVTDTVDLPAGSISNEALANPVATATASAGVSNYAIDTVASVRASVNLIVPDGFSRAIVISNAVAMGINSGTAAEYLYCSATVQAANGGELYTSAPAGIGASVSAQFEPTLIGLSGGDTITVGVATRTGTTTWAADPANQASISATAIFLK